MSLSDHPRSLEWLRQFPAKDVHTARLLLDSLKLVSIGEFESAIAQSIETICSSTQGYIAFTSIDKKVIDPVSKPGSEDRLAHVARNLQRQFPSRILISPSPVDMRANKVKHIVLVDDFIASGQRIVEFWDAWATATHKSWLSYHVCKLWLVSYAAHENGLKAALNRISYLAPESIRLEIRLTSNTNYWPQPVLDLCEQYALRTNLPRYPFGVGDLGVPLVFQHGCPDNCPVILWKNGNLFRALFPERGVPADFDRCFEPDHHSARTSQLLWNPSGHEAALELIEQLSEGHRSVEYIELVTVLALLNRRYRATNLWKVTTMPQSRITSILLRGRELSLVNQSDNITDFGRDIVKRSRNYFLVEASAVIDAAVGSQNYIPQQFQRHFCGAQAQSSNAQSL